MKKDVTGMFRICCSITV